MSTCAKCGKGWPTGYTHCPEDGTRLAVAATAGSPDAVVTMPEKAGDERVGDGAQLAAGTAVGEYVIDGKLGEGGMGTVYAATHPLIGKRAAIKVINLGLTTDGTAVQRFIQEARAVNQIRHGNIVDIFSFGELPDGRRYFVMEYLEGVSLADRVKEGGMSLREAIEILDQVCDALEAAHEKGIVHRDLKPDNVFLVRTRGGRSVVKLLDFGIAKLSTTGSMQKTRTGIVMGTPAYMSPEQGRGKSVDPRTDIYARSTATTRWT
jgi:serine/threonine-protein kinase